MPTKSRTISRGHRLRELRKASKLSLRDVEKKSIELAERYRIPELRLRRAWLSSMETRDAKPNPANFLVFSELYGFGLRDLIENYYRW